MVRSKPLKTSFGVYATGTVIKHEKKRPIERFSNLITGVVLLYFQYNIAGLGNINIFGNVLCPSIG